MWYQQTLRGYQASGFWYIVCMLGLGPNQGWFSSDSTILNMHFSYFAMGAVTSGKV